MARIRLIIATAALTALAFMPAAHADDDELEVTLQVLDDLSDLEGDITEMRGPGDDVFDDPVDLDEAEDDDGDLADDDSDETDERDERDMLVDESEFAGIEDDFEHDDVDDAMEEDLDEEDDFDEDEDVDDDEFDEDDDSDDMEDGDDDEPEDDVV